MKVRLVKYRTSPPQFAQVETDATVGAQIGTNLLMPDGTLATTAKLAALFGTGAGGSQALNTTDDLQEGQWNLWFTKRRAQDVVGGILTDSANVTLRYVGGTSITADLTTITDAGGGALLRFVRDAWGRITGTSAATTTDLAEGDNLYFTDDRADARITAQKGAAGGLAPLGSDAKINVSYLPAAVLGQVSYQGTWDANAGTPPTTTPSKGWYYIVTVAGSTSLSGITDWDVGDWAIYNGTAWDKVDNTDAISTWNGRTGAVVPQAGDYTAADVGAATSAQGAKADSAVQPGANVSVLSNDAGYVDEAAAAAAAPIQSLVAGTNVTIDATDPQNPVISASDGGGGAVSSVNGETGAVVLAASDIDAELSWAGSVQRALGAVAEDQVNSEWFSPDRTGAADASARLQMACDAAAGRVLTIRPGVYLLGASLQVSSHTTVIAYGCTFYRIGALNNLIRNKANGVTGAYSANQDIRVFGGTWDSVNGPGTPSGSCTVMAWGHCDRVFVDGATINNENEWHHIELNGSTRCTVRDCYFSGGYTITTGDNEAIQLDSADNASQFPWFGPYDGTFCQRIRILNCDFVNIGCGPGTHSAPTSNHNNIVIDGNHFFNVWGACIKPRDWSDIKITNNKGDSCYSGVFATPFSRAASDLSVIGNTFVHIGYGPNTGGDGRGIQVLSGMSDVRIANNNVLDVQGGNATNGITVDAGIRVTVTGNTVKGCNRAGIYIFGGQFVTVTGNAVTDSGLVISTYEDIRLGTGDFNASTRFNVEGNSCGKLGTYGLRFSLVRNNNMSISANHTGNSGTNVGDNLVSATFTAG